MSKTLLYETKIVLKELKNLRKAISKHSRAISSYDSYRLVNSSPKDHSKQKFYVVKKGSSKRRYLGTDESAHVKNIKTARYLKKLLQVVDNDIRLLETLDRDFVLPDHACINDLLPKVYRTDKPPVLAQSSGAAAEWKQKMEAEKEKFEPYRPEDLTFMAQDGTMMRSLSEVLIANHLLSLGITFVYELPLKHHGKIIRPDFTILSPVDNKTVIIIEHQGAMDSPEYQGKYIRTILFYLETKMIPNRDVFFTFNHLNRNLDLRQIDSILRIAFGFEGSSSAA